MWVGRWVRWLGQDPPPPPPELSSPLPPSPSPKEQEFPPMPFKTPFTTVKTVPNRCAAARDRRTTADGTRRWSPRPLAEGQPPKAVSLLPRGRRTMWRDP
uniref:Uncharacterized protein n=1 Tax=Eutreptiella gymnastica TaxID=73025 RepID=A0A7S4FH18_9EUGL